MRWKTQLSWKPGRLNSTSGSLVTWEKTGSNTPIYYLYDANGKLWGLNRKGSSYFYIRNSQSDIIGIIDTTGAAVVSYSYDAWGKVLNISGSLANTLGQDNPYRYRGYRYDDETRLYYLNSRYYNPEWCRFLNADSLIGANGVIFGHNIFAYCKNNPVALADPSGMMEIVTDNGQGSLVLAPPFVALSPDTQRKLKFITRVMNTTDSTNVQKELSEACNRGSQSGYSNIEIVITGKYTLTHELGNDTVLRFT